MTFKILRTDQDWEDSARPLREKYRTQSSLLAHHMMKEFTRYLMEIKKEQINPVQWTHYAWFTPETQEFGKKLEVDWNHGDEIAAEYFQEPELPGGSTLSQYGFPEGAKELQDLIEHREMNFAIGNIFKACYRMGSCSHSDKLRDLRKILWFAQRELDKESKG